MSHNWLNDLKLFISLISSNISIFITFLSPNPLLSSKTKFQCPIFLTPSPPIFLSDRTLISLERYQKKNFLTMFVIKVHYSWSIKQKCWYKKSFELIRSMIERIFGIWGEWMGKIAVCETSCLFRIPFYIVTRQIRPNQSQSPPTFSQFPLHLFDFDFIERLRQIRLFVIFLSKNIFIIIFIQKIFII
jgi:hypothetical protein